MEGVLCSSFLTYTASSAIDSSDYLLYTVTMKNNEFMIDCLALSMEENKPKRLASIYLLGYVDYRNAYYCHALKLIDDSRDDEKAKNAIDFYLLTINGSNGMVKAVNMHGWEPIDVEDGVLYSLYRPGDIHQQVKCYAKELAGYQNSWWTAAYRQIFRVTCLRTSESIGRIRSIDGSYIFIVTNERIICYDERTKMAKYSVENDDIIRKALDSRRNS